MFGWRPRDGLWVFVRIACGALAALRADSPLDIHADGDQGLRRQVAVAAARRAVRTVHHADVRPGRLAARADELLGLADGAVRPADGLARLLRRLRQSRARLELYALSDGLWHLVRRAGVRPGGRRRRVRRKVCTMAILRVLSSAGDTRYEWDVAGVQTGDEVAVAAVKEAERIFTEQRSRGATAFRVWPGRPAERLDSFDPHAEQ